MPYFNSNGTNVFFTVEDPILDHTNSRRLNPWKQGYRSPPDYNNGDGFSFIFGAGEDMFFYEIDSPHYKNYILPYISPNYDIADTFLYDVDE